MKFGKSGEVDESNERMETGTGWREWRSDVRRMAEGIGGGTLSGDTGGNGPSESEDRTWGGEREAP